MFDTAAMNDTTKRTALVTGASAGIGEAFARAYARRGMNLVLTARREDRLEKLALELGREHGCQSIVLPADLSRPDAPHDLFVATSAAGAKVDVLVNNAGYGVGGHYQHRGWRQHADFIQVMVTAVAHLVHLYLPDMIERGHGRVINVASVSGLLPGSKGHTLYGAAKSFLIKFSESLSLELAGTGVNVTATCPGLTYSEFHDVLGNRAQVSKFPRLAWMDADEVVEASIAACERRDPVYVAGRVNQALAGLTKLMPHRLAIMISARQSARFRAQE
jgi:short-subunit dehydrogenase